MKSIIYKANTRGFANHGWLKSYHTFSFANYYNAERNNFGKLRVFNDDIVKPKMGFGTHPHQNMEIVSIPITGALSHKDSMGNKRAIEVGEIQVMSAGTGITHSEFNDSNTDVVNFLQLWIIPEKMGVKPYYNQRKFEESNQINTIQTVVAPADKLEDKALPINQQAYIYRATIETNGSIKLTVKNANNGFYIFVIEGDIVIDNQRLNNRDAIGVYDVTSITLTTNKKSKLIIIEVPMQ